jgi:uncharacterized membrane protein
MVVKRRYRYQGGSDVPTTRLEALADGVFAIVMTLLVFGLGVPVVADATNGEVAEALREMWPEFLIYALSFMVLGAFWLMHKMMFDSIVASDPPLVWLNVLFLMITALLPFSTALVGEYRALGLVAFIYGLNLTLAFASATAIHAYATGGNRLTPDDVDAVFMRGATRMGIIYTLVMGAGAALAFVSALASYLVIATVVALFIAFTMVGRWEGVMAWVRSADIGAGTDQEPT